jgi:hypothetical protein
VGRKQRITYLVLLTDEEPEAIRGVRSHEPLELDAGALAQLRDDAKRGSRLAEGASERLAADRRLRQQSAARR